MQNSQALDWFYFMMSKIILSLIISNHTVETFVADIHK